MDQAIATRAPAHLWIAGVLSFLWNCMGAFDYLMTRLRNEHYLKQAGDPAAVLAYIDGMPMYAQVGWGLGVWGGLLGAVLLLMRSRFAVHAFAVSLVGAVVSYAAQYFGPPPPGAMGEGMMKYMPVVIIVLAVAQLW